MGQVVDGGVGDIVLGAFPWWCPHAPLPGLAPRGPLPAVLGMFERPGHISGYCPRTLWKRQGNWCLMA